MRRVVLAFAVLIVATFSMAVRAQDRVALVIANADYAVGRLANVASDADRIGRTLSALNFRVTRLDDATEREMNDAVRRFTNQLEADPTRIGFFYYAGHAVQIGGINYLLPLSADIADEDDVEFEAFDVERLLRQLATANNHANVVVLDACRNNPFRGLFRSPVMDLAGIGAPRNTMIAFSTGPNQLAPDNGLYAQTLAEELARPALYLDRVFRNVANRVDERTGSSQRPWLQLSVFPDVQLLPQSTPPPAVVQPLAPEMGLQVAQRTLRDLGFDPGPVDGKMGSATAGALGRFQRAQGLPATGRLDSATVAALEVARRIPPLREPVTPAVGVFPEYQPGDRFRDCDDCPEMVVVPAGQFMMGSTVDESPYTPWERPQHRVTIAEPIAVGVQEVTRGQFAVFVAETSYEPGNGCFGVEYSYLTLTSVGWRSPGFSQTDDHPVVCISWAAAKAYVKWLSARTGQAYRLLSEAEWEYAARAGTTTPFHFGQAISTDQANVVPEDYHPEVNPEVEGYRRQTVPVGSFPANAFGLHDVHGNVWEWVEDCRTESYAGAPANGVAWTTGTCRERVLRGGSWFSHPSYAASASRFWRNPDHLGNNFGFRVARTLR